MVVDEAARLSVANALEDYVEGRIGSRALNAVLVLGEKRDTACYELYFALVDDFYSIWEDHANSGKMALSARQRRMVGRWVCLLKSREEWPLPSRFGKPWLAKLISELWQLALEAACRRSPLDNEFWPYDTKDEWQRRFNME